MKRWMVGFVLVVLVGAGQIGGAVGFEVIQLTDNDYDDLNPRVSGPSVVWQGHDGNDWEIFLYDDGVSQLTQNAVDDLNPAVSGGSVVWRGHDGQDFEIFLYDGSTTTQLTDTGYDERPAEIAGRNIAWKDNTWGTRGISFYDGVTTVTLDGNSGCCNYMTDLGEAGVVWHSGSTPNYEVFFYDGDKTIRLSDGGWAVSAQMSGSNISWVGGSLDARKIYLYDGLGTTQLTDNATEDVLPEISGPTIVWSGWDGNDYEIFMVSLFPGPAPMLRWDGLGPGDWAHIDGTTGMSRWLDEAGDPLGVSPGVTADAVIRTDMVTVAQDHGARSLVVESGGVSIAPGQTLTVHNEVELASGAALQAAAGDTNGDGEVDNSDLMLILAGNKFDNTTSGPAAMARVRLPGRLHGHQPRRLREFQWMDQKPLAQ